MKTMISKYLSFTEVTKSVEAIKKGINNTPTEAQLERIKNWALNIFDPVREFVGAALGCWSVFRNFELNTEIGGAFNSQHMAENGAAGDIDCDIYGNGSNVDVFHFIRKELDFDQLIAEGIGNGKIEWNHCSYVSPEKNRKEVLMMYVKKGKKVYEKYTEVRFNQLLKQTL